MRILNVNTSLDFKSGGGTAERTFQMSWHLAQAGMECNVLTIDTGLEKARIDEIQPAKVTALPLLLRRFYIPVLRWRTILELVQEADIIHLMGHWTLINVLVYIAAKWARKPYVVCPAGALPIYGRSKLLKQFYNLVVGHRIVKNAAGHIAVTSGEFSHYAAYGISSDRVTVIPNGIDPTDFVSTGTEQEFLEKHGLSSMPIILFMGRLNPIKGPDLLLQAFAKHAKERLKEYQLVYVGPDEGLREPLEKMAAQQDLSDRVHFLGYLGGADKVLAYRSAKMLAIPSRHEAMSIVALEAGICGLPVIMTDQCGFNEISEVDARLEVPATAEGIAEGLLYLAADSVNTEKIAKNFEQFVSERYSWISMVPRYLDLYRHLLWTRSQCGS